MILHDMIQCTAVFGHVKFPDLLHVCTQHRGVNGVKYTDTLVNNNIYRHIYLVKCILFYPAVPAKSILLFYREDILQGRAWKRGKALEVK